MWLACREKDAGVSAMVKTSDEAGVRETRRKHAVRQEEPHQTSIDTEKANEGNHTAGIQTQTLAGFDQQSHKLPPMGAKILQ